MSQPPDDHLKALWQGQETETPTMTAQAVRMLVRDYGSETRARLMMVAAVAAVMAVPIAWTAWRAPNNGIRVGEMLDLIGIGWLLWRLRGRWPRRMPDAEASVSAVIDFHLAQLRRQRVGYGDTLVNIGPLIVGTATLFYGMHLVRPHAGLEKFGPFFGLIAIWAVLTWAMQRRNARRLNARIEEIDALRGG
jgi:hypothetical protein